jgi:hypothetical protein
VPKHVVVIASGETERRSLPHLVSHLGDEGVSIVEVRIPPSNRMLSYQMAEKLIKSVWHQNAAAPPDKMVVLVDADGSDPDEVLAPFKENLPGRLGGEIGATVLYAYAQWHLESWYFADAANLRSYLGQAPGDVDTSKPDEIQNPKLHLKNILGSRTYTARVSEEIARTLNGRTIAQRSPSFGGFLEAVVNGKLTLDTSGAL